MHMTPRTHIRLFAQIDGYKHHKQHYYRYSFRDILTVAVFILDDHKAVLFPRRVVTHNVGLLLEHGVRIYLSEYLLPGICRVQA